MHRAALFLALIVLAAPLCAGDDSLSATPWREVAHRDGVTISARTRAGSPIQEFRSVGEIDSPSRAIFAVLNDPLAYPTFMPYTAECRVLQQEKTSRITYQRLAPPLVANRDYTLRSDYRVTPGPAGPSYFIHWHLANELGPAPRAGVQRVQMCEGSWLLEPISGKKTRATYSIYSGTGGSIPSFLANSGSRIAICKLFNAVRKEARVPKYAAQAEEPAEVGAEAGSDRN